MALRRRREPSYRPNNPKKKRGPEILLSGGARRSAPGLLLNLPLQYRLTGDARAGLCPAARASAPAGNAACCTGAAAGRAHDGQRRAGRRQRFASGQIRQARRPGRDRRRGRLRCAVGSPFTSMRLATASSAGGGGALPCGRRRAGQEDRRARCSGVPSRITGPASGRAVGPAGFAGCAALRARPAVVSAAGIGSRSTRRRSRST